MPIRPDNPQEIAVSSSAVPPTREEINVQLSKLLRSEYFSNSELLGRFLRYVVENTLNGNADLLKEYRLGLDVFGRSEAFDPRIEPVVRTAAWRLRSKLQNYYENEGTDDPIKIDVPKGGYAAVFVRNSATETQEERASWTTIRTAESVVEKSAQVPRFRERMWLWIATTLFAAMILSAAYSYLRMTHPKVGEPALAVLPFLNLTGNPENEYLSDGLTDELTSVMAQLPGLRVAARTSAFHFKGRAEDIRTIGKQLNVSSLVEGSLEKRGDRLRVTVQLIRASDGYHIWAESYDVAVSDTPATEQEISRTIASQLHLKPVAQAGAQPHIPDPEAHDLYLRGRYYWNRRTLADLQKAINLFNQALQHDPLYARAYLGLAESYAVLGTNDQIPASEAYPKARAAAQQALQLDSGITEAHATLGNVMLFYDWDFDGAEREYKLALQLSPNYATVHQGYGVLLAYSGRLDEAKQQFRQAEDLDPLALVRSLGVGEMEYYSGNYDEAIRIARQAISYDSNFSISYALLGMSYLEKRQYEQALEALQKYSDLSGEDPDALMYIGQTYAETGQREKALVVIEHLKQVNAPAYRLAVVYAGLGDEKNAYDLLDQAVAQHNALCIQLSQEMAFKKMRSEPRFQKLLLETGHRTKPS